MENETEEPIDDGFEPLEEPLEMDFEGETDPEDDFH